MTLSQLRLKVKIVGHSSRIKGVKLMGWLTTADNFTLGHL